MIGPVLFVGVSTLEGWLRPGYDSFGMFLSELSLGPRGGIQIGNFLACGVLSLLFARGMAAEFSEGDDSGAGPIALYVIATGWVAAAFVMDPLSTPLASRSWHCWIHVLSGQLITFGMPISCFVFYGRFQVDRHWRSLATWTYMVGWLTVALEVVLLGSVAWIRFDPGIRSDPGNLVGAWAGLMQRMWIFGWLAWQFVVAGRLYTSPEAGTVPESSVRTATLVRRHSA